MSSLVNEDVAGGSLAGEGKKTVSKKTGRTLAKEAAKQSIADKTIDIDELFGESAGVKSGRVVKPTAKKTDAKKTAARKTTRTPAQTAETSAEKTAPEIKTVPAPSAKNKGGGAKFAVLTILLAIIFGASAGFGGSYLYGQYFSPATNVTINAKDTNAIAQAVAKKALPSVVGIVSTNKVRYQDFFGGSQEEEQSGLGTGFVVDKDGYILTNSHVVMDGEVDKITVVLPSQKQVSGEIVYNDTGVDIAVVKIDVKNLPPATLGDSENLEIGQFACAIGNPTALEYYGTVTQGIVSGLDRTIGVSDGSTQTQMENLIQVDAAINGGNSGGPLLNEKGEVVGINTAKAGSSSDGTAIEGMGFAIPINVAKPIVKSIKEKGEYKRPILGIQAISLSDAIAAGEVEESSMGVSEGVYIAEVSPNSPASRAGFQTGDVITGIGNDEVKSYQSMVKILLNYEYGDKIEVEYYRAQTKHVTSVTLNGETNT